MLTENYALTEERNSSIRHQLSGILNTTAEKFVETFPGITADHVTWAGAICAVACSLWQARRNRENFLEGKNHKPFFPLALNSLFSSFDLFDGTIARVRSNLYPEKVNKLGWAHDVTADRFGELGRLFAGVKTAESMGGWVGIWGKVTSIALGVLKDWPGIARADKESKGIVVNEAGKNPLEFFGTSGGRTLLEIGALYLPIVRRIPVLPIVNTFLLGTTINTAIKRSKEDGSNQQVTLPKEKIEDAKLREYLLIGLSVGSGLFFLGRELLHTRRSLHFQ